MRTIQFAGNGKIMQKLAIKLNSCKFDEKTQVIFSPILIGVESIIVVKKAKIKTYGSSMEFECTEVQSRQAMAITHYVTETIEEIYALINEK